MAGPKTSLDVRADPTRGRRQLGAVSSLAMLALSSLALSSLATSGARADESATSFWLPGTFGSLAAAPAQPGFSFASVYYHTSVSAGADVIRSREIQVGRLNPTINTNLNASLQATGDVALLIPSYVFGTPVLGGQFAVQVAAIVGRSSAAAAGTLTAGVPPFSLIRSIDVVDSSSGFGDLYPQASLKWNYGTSNIMTYVSGDIPVGNYNAGSIANMGLGHAAIDGGGGYTYFDPTKGHEFSAVAGFTYNFMNQTTNYQSGVDFHLDWAVSQFLSKQFFLGAVGYVYNQISDDSGSGARLGGFRSRVLAVGPQVGYIFPLEGRQAFLGLKAYYEFDAQNRPQGFNTWLTLSVSDAAATARPAPLIRK
ncbi:MAG: hypothetical protein JWR73_2305 [Tardiphaga sp.]|nr:hypothetical protein [Tardiphaga sp.]